MAQVNTTYGTYLSDLFNPQVIADLIDSKLTDNIVFASLAMVDNTLTGRAGDTISLPYYSYISAASIVTEGTDIPLAKLAQTTTSISVVKYCKAIQLTDEAVLSGYGDPLGEGTRQIALAIADALDGALLQALADNSASEQNYVVSDSTSTLMPADIPLALAKFGEDYDGTKVLLVNPDFYAKLLGENWIPASEIAAEVKVRGAIGMVYGCQVVVTNRLKNTDEAYIVKPGSLALFMKRDTLIETDRDILNQSTVVAGSKICAPYLLNPAGMVHLSVSDGT